jgi:DNA primase
MDVVALAQFGVGYAVAALGTATTSDHIRILMRQSDRIYFCFDGDGAGQKAAWRALENALPILQDGKTLNFLFLPTEHDPDSYIREHGKENFEQQLFEQSLPLSAYFLKHLTSNVQLNTPEGKANLIKQSAPLLAQIKATSLSFLLKQRLSELVSIEQDDLDGLLGQQVQKKGGLKQLRLPPKTNRLAMPSLVHKQIKSLLMNPSWAVHVKIPEYLPLGEEMACLTTLSEAAKKMGENANSSNLLEYMRHSKFEILINDILHDVDNLTDTQNTPTQEELNNFTDGIEKLLQQVKNAQLEQLIQKNQEVGLSSEETKLLLALLNRT